MGERMNGLLDFIKTPEGQGLLSAVAGGFAGARRGAPLNTIGAAGLSGLRGYSNALDRESEGKEREFQSQYRQTQMDQLRNQMEAQRRQQAEIDRFGATIPEQDQPLFRVAPQDYIKNMPQFQKPQLVEIADPNEPLRNQKVWMRPGDAQGTVAGFGAMPEILDPRVQAAKKDVAASGRPVTPFYNFLPTANGYAVGDARTGNITPVSINGAPVIKASDSPELQGRIAKEKEIGKTTGEELTKAQFDAPRAVQVAETAIKHVDELLAHPGFDQAVGKSSMVGIQKIPGTKSYDFMNRLDQVKGGAFLEAFNQLKGGGQITEVEGKKATDALARMNNTTSEEEFKAAAKDFKDTVAKGMQRAKAKAGGGQPQQKSVVRQGMYNGKRVIEYSDGSVDYAN